MFSRQWLLDETAPALDGGSDHGWLRQGHRDAALAHAHPVEVTSQAEEARGHDGEEPSGGRSSASTRMVTGVTGRRAKEGVLKRVSSCVRQRGGGSRGGAGDGVFDGEVRWPATKTMKGATALE